jgi:hypothetical protein
MTWKAFTHKNAFMNPFVFLGVSLAYIFLAACSNGGGSDFASLDASNGAANIPCKIMEKSPSASSTKVASADGTKTIFNVSPSTSSCRVFYYANGTKINSISSNYIELDSATLTANVNTLRVEVQNDLGSDSFEWSVAKNTPPSCTRAAPTTSSMNMITSGSQSFTVNASAEAGETLTFKWLLDGTASSALLETITAATASQALFNASSSLVGVKTISAEVSDGYDSTTCHWTVNVGEECALTAKSPNVASPRMAAASGSSSAFAVTATTPTCLISWTLNGVDLSGNGSNRSLSSSDLNTGSNVLKAEVTSTSGTTSQLWTVIKNSPPTCAQSPAATGSQTSVNSTLNLTANVSDANNDPVTWSWKLNGSATTSPPVSVVNGTNTTTAAFTPNSANIGFNSFELRLDDGYDTATCTWSTQVKPECQISSQSPSSSTLTIPNLGATVNVDCTPRFGV